MANVYNRAKSRILAGDLLLDSDTIKCILVGTGYTYANTHNTVSDLGANELTYTGSGGAGRPQAVFDSVVQGNPSDVRYDAVTFPAVSAAQTVRACILYESIADDGTDNLIAYYNCGDLAANGGDIVIRFNSTDPGEGIRLSDT